MVDNVLYHWNDVKIVSVKDSGINYYKLLITSNPGVINRRKYKRMPLFNLCSITMKSSNCTYEGKMVNISANGFAFSTKEQELAAARGDMVELLIEDFKLLEGRILDGCIIRATNNGGEYIVGCRMPEDNKDILEYVNQNYKD